MKARTSVVVTFLAIFMAGVVVGLLVPRTVVFTTVLPTRFEYLDLHLLRMKFVPKRSEVRKRGSPRIITMMVITLCRECGGTGWIESDHACNACEATFEDTSVLGEICEKIMAFTRSWKNESNQGWVHQKDHPNYVYTWFGLGDRWMYIFSYKGRGLSTVVLDGSDIPPFIARNVETGTIVVSLGMSFISL